VLVADDRCATLAKVRRIRSARLASVKALGLPIGKRKRLVGKGRDGLWTAWELSIAQLWLRSLLAGIRRSRTIWIGRSKGRAQKNGFFHENTVPCDNLEGHINAEVTVIKKGPVQLLAQFRAVRHTSAAASGVHVLGVVEPGVTSGLAPATLAVGLGKNRSGKLATFWRKRELQLGKVGLLAIRSKWPI
jgi:hypothetical protein